MLRAAWQLPHEWPRPRQAAVRIAAAAAAAGAELTAAFAASAASEAEEGQEEDGAWPATASAAGAAAAGLAAVRSGFDVPVDDAAAPFRIAEIRQFRMLDYSKLWMRISI